jgi:lipid-binding SYLF domain-containing protein
MRKPMQRVVAPAAALLALALASSSVEAQEDWKSLKRESKRMKIDETAKEALDVLLAKSPKAEMLLHHAYGWAVFDNLKLALGFSGGGGNGVAVVKDTGERTYMQMGTAGIGLGLGANSYQVVFLFQDEQTFRTFVDNGWQADATASAVAGEAGAEAKTNFTNGLAIFQLTDKGLMLHADLAGTKYWKNKKLNE